MNSWHKYRGYFADHAVDTANANVVATLLSEPKSTHARHVTCATTVISTHAQGVCTLPPGLGWVPFTVMCLGCSRCPLARLGLRAACDVDMQPILRREDGTFRGVNISLVRTVHRTALVSSCAPDLVHSRDAERGSKNEDFQNNRRHIHRTTKRGLGSKQNTLVISSRSRRRDVGSGHGTGTLGVGVSIRFHGAQSEHVILEGDTPHRLAQGAVNMRKWSPFFTATRWRGGMKKHENSA